MKGIVSIDTLNIRKEPNMHSRIVGKLKKSDIIDIIDIIGSKTSSNSIVWYQVDYGYIPSGNVTIIDPRWEVVPKMSTSEIQSVFNHGGQIVVRRGTYKIESTIKIQDDSQVTFESGAEFIKMCEEPVMAIGYDCLAKKYNGGKNISITGGQFIGYAKGTVVAFCHGLNISFTNFSIVGSVKGSPLLIIGCCNVNINNFKISQCKMDWINNPALETIQLGFANPVYFNYLPYGCKFYDNTHNKHIIISKGVIRGTAIGIGSHAIASNRSNKHNHITISECVFYGRGCAHRYGSGIRLMDTDHINIANNQFYNYDVAIKFDIPGYAIDENGDKITKLKRKTADKGCKNILCSRNIVMEPSGISHVSGISFITKMKGQYHSDAKLISNSFLISSNPNAIHSIYSQGACKNISYVANGCDIDNSVEISFSKENKIKFNR